MTDLVITAASVVAGAGARTKQGIAGVTITAGQAVYKDSSTGKYALADNDGASALRTPEGIALNSCALNQPIIVQTLGLLTLGATLTPGLAYYLSNTPGGICPIADVGAAEYVTLVGLATSAALIDVTIKHTGVAN